MFAIWAAIWAPAESPARIIRDGSIFRACASAVR